MVSARQQHGKHDSAVTDTDITIEGTVFSMQPLQGNGMENNFPQQRINTQQNRSR
jgi:hypothetical protein